MSKNNDIPIKYREALAKYMAENPSTTDPRIVGERTLGLWDRAARESGGMGPDYDYGFAGKLDGRGHAVDDGKLPTHPTFSTQSHYAGLGIKIGIAPGKWEGNTFTMSEDQYRRGNANILAWLMDRGLNHGDIYKLPDGTIIKGHSTLIKKRKKSRR